MVFEYIALTTQGSTIADIIDAPSEVVARQRLRNNGLYIVKILKQDTVTVHGTEGKINIINTIFDKISHHINLRLSTKEISTFSRQLSTMLKAGMPLLVSISTIIDQIENPVFKKIIIDVKTKVEEGSSLSNALDLHKNIFSEMYINMIRVGESLGSLDSALERLADLEEKRNLLKSKVQSALWYPAFMILFAFGVVTFLMISIIPSLGRMFAELGKDLPLPTTIVMGISNFIVSFWYVILIVIIFAIYYFNRYKNTEEGRRKLDELKLKLPLVSSLYKKLLIHRFTYNLGVLLTNKVDVIKSFDIVQRIIRNVLIQENIARAAKLVQEGSSIANALSRERFLPQYIIGMIAAGESSDTVDEMLLNIGKIYENDIDLSINSMTSLIEPIIIVCMGFVIGLIVISVLLPIFEMNLIVK
ncbi:MAG TPA: type II secretion system F family protein [Spirochaetota bacterium]|nr:type II secretion system F family protein [Spirochaetota bacterium]HRR60393.1 type II secretion system F family protein [Spirochaetota bacterium]HRV14891.1 type II secretion system F family protein [Spirochaetota bacterium]